MRKRLAQRRCYHHNEMRPQSIGRALELDCGLPGGWLASEWRSALRAPQHSRRECAAAQAAGAPLCADRLRDARREALCAA